MSFLNAADSNPYRLARIIAGTRINLRNSVSQGLFRDDLYFFLLQKGNDCITLYETIGLKISFSAYFSYQLDDVKKLIIKRLNMYVVLV